MVRRLTQHGRSRPKVRRPGRRHGRGKRKPADSYDSAGVPQVLQRGQGGWGSADHGQVPGGQTLWRRVDQGAVGLVGELGDLLGRDLTGRRRSPSLGGLGLADRKGEDGRPNYLMARCSSSTGEEPRRTSSTGWRSSAGRVALAGADSARPGSSLASGSWSGPRAGGRRLRAEVETHKRRALRITGPSPALTQSWRRTRDAEGPWESFFVSRAKSDARSSACSC